MSSGLMVVPEYTISKRCQDASHSKALLAEIYTNWLFCFVEALGVRRVLESLYFSCVCVRRIATSLNR